MREAAVALFRLFQSVDDENYINLKKWAEQNINNEMYVYALRLDSLYGTNTPQNSILPPFILNPRYFVNSETITKAFTMLEDLKENGKIDPATAEEDQYDEVFSAFDRKQQFIVIDSNYSGWNLPKNGIDEDINYFREDVGLNSYYLGMHLLHPFWMSNEELDMSYSRHAEHYYYVHQQLMARYLLEKEHLPKNKPIDGRDDTDYVPYLSYKNGLPFPTRSCIRGDWDSEKALIKSIDIAIKECIARGLIIMENGTAINLTDDSHIEELSKLIRANLDGVKTAKVVRSVFGYGSNRSPIDKYNPAPSLLHHPETSLRDPVYWYLIQSMLNYFTEYKNTMEPYDLTQYETEEIKIIDNDEITNLYFASYFHSYKFPLDYARNTKANDIRDQNTYIAVRQRRLQHEDFEIPLSFETSAEVLVVVRLYLGPQCGSNCWQEYSKFFELDTHVRLLQKGYTHALVSSKSFKQHSFDSLFDSVSLRPEIARKSNSYSTFKFPDNLLIPRGLKSGLNLTLFVMVTPVDVFEDLSPLPIRTNNYGRAVEMFDSKPLGFPFHRPAAGFKEAASNYRFYNITVYHKQEYLQPKATFTPNLY
ncbi:Hexamerin 4 [Operophtera brumata]|uniref:Hexamerin 4 n=1 Tax=Operophtera brumata TaxID=104452 RepID=A0A0L7LMR1_OPEBR|nr:Hexamerin 4 [Operophtera brumata]